MKALQNILFLDIETISGHDNFEALNERAQKQWLRKASFIKRNEEVSAEELYFEKAGIYAEFGQVIVIGLGYFHQENDVLTFRVKTLSGKDEVELLNEFKAILNKMDDEVRLCAHNGREFDFPYLSRRMLINGISLPTALDLSGKKPWEINHLDTMDMWKFGDWKHYTSLELLATVFNIESSKSKIDGSMVNEVFYKNDDLETIAEYCKDDVLVTAQVYSKLKGIDLGEFNIVVAK